MTSINYTAPKTCAAFMKSEIFGRLIAGPVGSGKTTACIFELLRRAAEQAPAQDGLRYTRFAIVRQTLKQLKDTVLKDIVSWLNIVANYKVSDNTVYISVGDIRSEWLLIPLEDQEDQRRLLSMQLTGAWMSECVEMDVSIVAPLSGRLGRYPTANQGGASWFGWIADTNMPSEGSDWWKFMTEPSPDTQIFIQPSGMAPDAENLEWLVQTPETLKLAPDHPVRRAQGRTYYERFVRQYGEHSDWCRRFVYSEFGDDPSGTAVFRDSFKQAFHVVDNVEPVFGHPLIIGQDFGRDPWSIICQLDHKGRLLVLQEVPAVDTGLELHINRNLKPVLNSQRFIGRPVAVIGDPAGRAKDSIHEETSFDAIKRMGLVSMPAPTNDPDARIRAVEAFLLSQRDGGPALVFDRKGCPTLIRAMAGGYRFGKTKAGLRKPAPDKNEFSHPSDALQYAALVAHGGMTDVVARRLTPRRPSPRKFTARAWT